MPPLTKHSIAAVLPNTEKYGSMVIPGGTPVFVLNTNAKATTPAVADPYSLVAGDFANANNNSILIENTERLPLLTLWLRATADVTTAPIVRVFGGFRYNKPFRTNGPRQPSDADSLFDPIEDIGGQTAADSRNTEWVPLHDVRTGLHLIDMGANHAANVLKAVTNGNPQRRAFRVLSNNNLVFTQGADLLVLTISQAAASSGPVLVTGRLHA